MILGIIVGAVVGVIVMAVVGLILLGAMWGNGYSF
jgi:hypothetical protein